MTNQEWYNLQRTLLQYNGKVSDYSKRKFLEIIRNSNEALQSGVLLFKDRGTYDAQEFQIDRFVKQFIRFSNENIKRNKAKEKRERKKIK